MGIYQQLVNFDKLFHEHSTGQQLFINDFGGYTEEESDAFNRLIYTTHTSDLLSNVPTCDCGRMRGAHLLGIICEVCHVSVHSSLEQNLEPIAWLRTPDMVEKLMSPHIWGMLTKRFKRNGFSIIRWLVDPRYTPQVQQPPVLNEIMAKKWPRSWNFFVKNFDTIMDFLFNLKNFRVKRGETDPVRELICVRARDCVFTDYLPIPNRSLLIIEEKKSMNMMFIDTITPEAIDAIRTLQGIDTEVIGSTYSLSQREQRVVRVIDALSNFYDEINANHLAQKDGTYRKHIYATRSHWSARCVIDSITGRHDYDELHLPWAVSLSLFSVHLRSKLMRRGYTPGEAMALIDGHAKKFNQFLYDLLNDLIAESPWTTRSGKRGIPCVFQRNPSLERASAQLLFITVVKPDPAVATISYSILCVKGHNADFDGKLNCCRKTSLIAGNPYRAWLTTTQPETAIVTV